MKKQNLFYLTMALAVVIAGPFSAQRNPELHLLVAIMEGVAGLFLTVYTLLLTGHKVKKAADDVERTIALPILGVAFAVTGIFMIALPVCFWSFETLGQYILQSMVAATGGFLILLGMFYLKKVEISPQ